MFNNQFVDTSNNIYQQYNPNHAQIQLAEKDQMIARLLERVETLELAQQSGSGASTLNKNTKGTKLNNHKKKTNTLPKLSKSQPTSQKNTPKKPASKSVTPKSSPGLASKKNPLQMIMREQPAGFERTKVCSV